MKLSLETLSQSLAQDFWRVLSTLKAQTFESKGVWRLSMNVNVEEHPTFFRFTYFSGRNPGKWVCCQQKVTWVLWCYTVRSTVQALAGVASRSWAKELSNPFRNLIIQRVWKGVKPACALLNLVWRCCADGMCSCFPAARIYFSRMCMWISHLHVLYSFTEVTEVI